MPPSPLNDVTPPSARAPGRSVAVRLLAGYAFLGVWGALSVLLTRMNALWLGLAVTVLATPAMLWLWHRYTVRRLAALHQFQPGGWLHRFGRRTGLGIVLRALVALALGIREHGVVARARWPWARRRCCKACSSPWWSGRRSALRR